MFIIVNNKPYAYDKAENKVYGVTITGLQYSIDKTSSTTPPSTVNCIYTIDEIRQRFNCGVNRSLNLKTGKISITSNGTISSDVEDIDEDLISVSANNSSYGTVTGGGTFRTGTSCTLKATANDGYTFSKWTKGGTEVSTNATYTFTVETEGSYVAVFTANENTITVAANDDTYGTVTGGGTYTTGAEVTISATAGEGYEFSKWKKGDTEVSTSATYTFSCPAGGGTYTAEFVEASQSEEEQQ